MKEIIINNEKPIKINIVEEKDIPAVDVSRKITEEGTNGEGN